MFTEGKHNNMKNEPETRRTVVSVCFFQLNLS